MSENNLPLYIPVFSRKTDTGFVLIHYSVDKELADELCIKVENKVISNAFDLHRALHHFGDYREEVEMINSLSKSLYHIPLNIRFVSENNLMKYRGPFPAEMYVGKPETLNQYGTFYDPCGNYVANIIVPDDIYKGFTLLRPDESDLEDLPTENRLNLQYKHN